jgi:hypothetical protein
VNQVLTFSSIGSLVSHRCLFSSKYFLIFGDSQSNANLSKFVTTSIFTIRFQINGINVANIDNHQYQYLLDRNKNILGKKNAQTLYFQEIGNLAFKISCSLLVKLSRFLSMFVL